jgi:hypothetical protein
MPSEKQYIIYYKFCTIFRDASDRGVDNFDILQLKERELDKVLYLINVYKILTLFKILRNFEIFNKLIFDNHIISTSSTEDQQVFYIKRTYYYVNIIIIL